MARIVPGRFTAQADGPFVVFLIGMRINRFLAFRTWIATLMAMGPMLRTLYEHAEKGFLGAHTFLAPRGVVVLQYWRSFADLERFAHAEDDPHVPAWRRFVKAVGYKDDAAVGIWHETYLVEAGHYEALYGNMPVFGLAAATQHVSAVGRRATARQRLTSEQAPSVAAHEPNPVEP